MYIMLEYKCKMLLEPPEDQTVFDNNNYCYNKNTNSKEQRTTKLQNSNHIYKKSYRIF